MFINQTATRIAVAVFLFSALGCDVDSANSSVLDESDETLDDECQAFYQRSLQGGTLKEFLRSRAGVRFDDWHQAAKSGNPTGQCFFGACLKYGVGADRDENAAVLWIQKAAEAGHAVAQYQLGHHYSDTNAVDAVKWYRAAAEQGYADAQIALAFHYDGGDGVPHDLKQCFAWTLRAAEQGNVMGQTNLGILYSNGKGVSKDENLAVEWFRQAAEQGHARAQIFLGQSYEDGLGVKKNMQSAVEWFRKAADQEHPHAIDRMGYFYLHGLGVREDFTAAAMLFREAADMGHANGLYNYGNCLENGIGVKEDWNLAMQMYERAASNGHVSAKKKLQENREGLALMDSLLGTETMKSKADHAKLDQGVSACLDRGAKHRREAEESLKNVVIRKIQIRQLLSIEAVEREVTGRNPNRGHLENIARNRLLRDASLKQGNLDYQLAIQEFEQAAEQGHSNEDARASAQNSLGELFVSELVSDHLLIRRQPVRAVGLFRAAAKRGVDRARFNLGYCYETGIGVKRDLAQAINWYSGAESMEAQYRLAMIHLYDAQFQNVDLGIRYLKAAAAETLVARFELGLCHQRGLGVVLDVNEGRRLIQLAAEDGLPAAQNALAVCHANGVGVKSDLNAAFKWLEKSALQDYSIAQFNLGILYARGDGRLRDLVKSAYWFRIAADQGYGPAKEAYAMFLAYRDLEQQEEAVYQTLTEGGLLRRAYVNSRPNAIREGI